jgi:PAS domain S-box-containing protein
MDEEVTGAELLERQLEALRAENAELCSQLSFQSSLLDHAHSAVIAIDLNGIITHWNRFAEKLYQWTAEEAIGRNIMDTVIPEGQSQLAQEITAEIARSGFWAGEFRAARKDRSTFLAFVVDSVVLDKDGVLAGIVGVSTDITERKQLEQRLWQSQKIESLATLAAGVAHDFNNLLSAILGNASLLQDLLKGVVPAQKLLNNLVAASEDAAGLVQQVLAYAGKGKAILQPVDLSRAARDARALIQASVPEQVELQWELKEDLPPIHADPNQIQQVMMNLLLNAVEAIGKNPGCVTVRTGMERIDKPFVQSSLMAHNLAPGDYVFVEVRDTGCGMDEVTKARIFDPFFTTKFTGRGLGLAAAHGIVTGHNGALAVQTSLGRGSVFQIYLPAASSGGD